MMLSPTLLAALESIGVAFIGSSIFVPIASKLSDFISSRERTVSLKLESGQEVRLELDRHLSLETASALVEAAVRSAQSGDNTAVRRAVDASHRASQDAREAAG